MSIAQEAETDPAIAIARAAIAREIVAEFNDIPKAERDAFRAADRIIALIRKGGFKA
jgi:hypothetical protein